MMKTMKKWGAVVFSLAVALSLAVPAFAASAGDGTLLNVRFAPNGTGVNSTADNPVVYTAYRLAETAADGAGGYTYTLTPTFAGAGVDVNGLLNGAQVNASSDAYRQMLSAFGSYINANGETIRENAGDDVRTAETQTHSIGTAGTSTQGVAQFTNLPDGLYLVTTSASVWIDGTQYIPVPFLVNVPYVSGGIANTYLTATVKFTTQTPGGPGTPSPSPSPSPTTPTTPTTPPATTQPTTPTQPEEPEVEILPEDVPLAQTPEEEPPEIELPEDEVPLANLPQTGLLWWPVPVLAVAGAVLVTVGVVRSKADRDG